MDRRTRRRSRDGGDTRGDRRGSPQRGRHAVQRERPMDRASPGNKMGDGALRRPSRGLRRGAHRERGAGQDERARGGGVHGGGGRAADDRPRGVRTMGRVSGYARCVRSCLGFVDEVRQSGRLGAGRHERETRAVRGLGRR